MCSFITSYLTRAHGISVKYHEFFQIFSQTSALANFQLFGTDESQYFAQPRPIIDYYFYAFVYDTTSTCTQLGRCTYMYIHL